MNNVSNYQQQQMDVRQDKSESRPKSKKRTKEAQQREQKAKAKEGGTYYRRAKRQNGTFKRESETIDRKHQGRECQLEFL